MLKRFKDIFGVTRKPEAAQDVTTPVDASKLPKTIKSNATGPVTWGNLPDDNRVIRGDAMPGFTVPPSREPVPPRTQEVEAGDDDVFDWDAFCKKLDDVAAAAIEREQNKPWEDDGEYEYRSN